MSQNKPQRRKGRGEQELVTLRMLCSEVELLDQFCAELKQFVKVRLSRSYLLREGARQLMVRLRREVNKARRGEYHAKKRPANENQEKETVAVLGFRKPSSVRRRRVVGDYRPRSVQAHREGGQD